MVAYARAKYQPSSHTPLQLDFLSGPERQELEQLRVENAALRARLGVAKHAFRTLRTERDTWKNGHDTAAAILARRTEECAELQRQVGRLQIAIRCLESTVSLLQSLSSSSQQGPVPALRREDLTQLLVLAHPDKWSQGQPATELAHELAVVVNSLRARLGVER